MWLRHIILSCLLFMVAGCSANDSPTRHNTFVPLTSIEVTGAYEAMADQTVNQYRAVGDFSGAFTRDITSEVTWSIENNDIAFASNAAGSEGLVTALKPGATTVTAMYGEIWESATVIVTNAFLTGIEISPVDAQLQVGVTQQYEAAGTFSDGSVQEITKLTTWESSATEIASINTAGLVTTLAAGSSTIKGVWQGLESSTSLSVNSAKLTSITINPGEAVIARGTTEQFEAEGAYSDSSTKDITDMVDWKSSATGVGIITAGGLATGVAAGETEISASLEVDGETISATAGLTVTGASIRSISLSPANSTITKGSNQQFIATGGFSDGSEQDITDLASWFTSNSTAGTISNSSGSRGFFVSIAPGVTVIEAIFDGVKGETLLTVN